MCKRTQWYIGKYHYHCCYSKGGGILRKSRTSRPGLGRRYHASHPAKVSVCSFYFASFHITILQPRPWQPLLSPPQHLLVHRVGPAPVWIFRSRSATNARAWPLWSASQRHAHMTWYGCFFITAVDLVNHPLSSAVILAGITMHTGAACGATGCRVSSTPDRLPNCCCYTYICLLSPVVPTFRGVWDGWFHPKGRRTPEIWLSQMRSSIDSIKGH